MEERWKVGQGWLRDCGGDCCADARSKYTLFGVALLCDNKVLLFKGERGTVNCTIME